MPVLRGPVWCGIELPAWRGSEWGRRREKDRCLVRSLCPPPQPPQPDDPEGLSSLSPSRGKSLQSLTSAVHTQPRYVRVWDGILVAHLSAPSQASDSACCVLFLQEAEGEELQSEPTVGHSHMSAHPPGPSPGDRSFTSTTPCNPHDHSKK